MEVIISETLRLESKRDREFIIGQMDLAIKGFGKTMK
jgi:hypothetical protein